MPANCPGYGNIAIRGQARSYRKFFVILYKISVVRYQVLRQGIKYSVMNSYLSKLTETLRETCAPDLFTWLEQALLRISDSDDIENELAKLSAMARRKTGNGHLDPELAPIVTPLGELNIGGWPVADAARTALILKAIETADGNEQSLVEFLFRHGDETERAAIARALSLLDTGTALKLLLLEAGRANSLQLVSAVSLGNPYPAAHYSEPEFNQLVLKALFLGLPIEPVVGLEQRCNPELSRMCEDYYDERTAAQRTVPVDIWLALGPCASSRGESLMLEHLSHDSPGHRCYAATAIGRRLTDHPRLRDALASRKKTETNKRVMSALNAVLTE